MQTSREGLGFNPATGHSACLGSPLRALTPASQEPTPHHEPSSHQGTHNHHTTPTLPCAALQFPPEDYADDLVWMAGRLPEEVVSILRKGSVGFARWAHDCARDRWLC